MFRKKIGRGGGPLGAAALPLRNAHPTLWCGDLSLPLVLFEIIALPNYVSGDFDEQRMTAFVNRQGQTQAAMIAHLVSETQGS